MDFERLSADLRDLRQRNQRQALVIGGLAGCLVLSLSSNLMLLGAVRTVVVPPTLNKSFWVTDAKASSDYLEQMGSFIAWLVLDVTPSTIDWKKEMLLSYVDPAQYGALKSRQEVEAERLKRISASTAFAPQQVVADELSQSLVVRGRLRTLVNGHETANDLKAYRIDFGYAGGRAHVVGFKEVPYAVR
jgi:conjugal transfer pilus assembly protein TraE